MAKLPTTHETLSRDETVKEHSDRSFGLVFAVFFGLVAVWPLVSGDLPRWWSAAFSVGFLVLAFACPSLLAPLNRIWMRFGRLLHAIMTPVILGVLFLLVVTPTALLMRIFGKVPIPLRFESQAKSYWIERRPPGPAPDTMDRQF